MEGHFNDIRVHIFSLMALLVIYADSALMGGIGGALYARKRAEEGGR